MKKTVVCIVLALSALTVAQADLVWSGNYVSVNSAFTRGWVTNTTGSGGVFDFQYGYGSAAQANPTSTVYSGPLFMAGGSHTVDSGFDGALAALTARVDDGGNDHISFGTRLTGDQHTFTSIMSFQGDIPGIAQDDAFGINLSSLFFGFDGELRWVIDDGTDLWISQEALQISHSGEGFYNSTSITTTAWAQFDGSGEDYEASWGAFGAGPGLTDLDGAGYYWSADRNQNGTYTSGIGIDQFQVVAIPEPSSLALLLVGVIGVRMYRRRHRG